MSTRGTVAGGGVTDEWHLYDELFDDDGLWFEDLGGNRTFLSDADLDAICAAWQKYKKLKEARDDRS